MCKVLHRIEHLCHVSLLIQLPANCTAEAEGEAGQRHHAEAAKFMKNAEKEIYGTSGNNGGSLQDRVTRQKYYIDRKPDDSNAFRRGG